MATPAPAPFLEALVAEFAASIAAVAGADIPVSPGAGFTGAGLTASLTVTGDLRGTVRMTLDDAGVAALLHAVLGPEADTSDAAAADLVREMLGQAIGSLCLKEPYTKVSIAVGSVGRADSAPDQTMRFALGVGATPLELVAAATIDAMPLAARPVDPPEVPAPPAKAQPARTGHGGLPPNLETVMDIELPLSIRFGSTAMSIRALSTLGPGAIVDMGRSPDDPVEVLVCGRVVARAEVVIVGGNYGIRITDLVSAADRVRAMEGQW
ncbi:MAG: FliM/FliN family flagellar motor switch protein [Vicinamibacterales bacterium]